MNTVSFRDSLLDTIDDLNAVVTESADDVFYSLAGIADKASVIMENCEDADEIWKYSIWQEADQAAIDKDAHPFKENSTLKTILMLPINLIRLIIKTISQAFAPQKVEETSKAAAAVDKAKTVVKKAIPFLFTTDENGNPHVNIPVVIGLTAAGGAITLDGIIRKSNSVIANIVKLMQNAFAAIRKMLIGVREKDLPEKFVFTAVKGETDKWQTNLDIKNAKDYIDKSTALIAGLDAKFAELENASDADRKTKAEALQKELKQTAAMCPIYKELKTYTTDEVSTFYKDVSQTIQKVDAPKMQQSVAKYQSFVKNDKEGAAKTEGGNASNDELTKTKSAKALATFFMVYNRYCELVGQIPEAFKEVAKFVEITDKAVGELGGGDNADVVAGEEGKNVQIKASTVEEVKEDGSTVVTKGSAEPPKQGDDSVSNKDEYTPVTGDTPPTDWGTPNKFYEKDGEGNYKPVEFKGAGTEQDPYTPTYEPGKYYTKNGAADGGTPPIDNNGTPAADDGAANENTGAAAEETGGDTPTSENKEPATETQSAEASTGTPVSDEETSKILGALKLRDIGKFEKMYQKGMNLDKNDRRKNLKKAGVNVPEDKHSIKYNSGKLYFEYAVVEDDDDIVVDPVASAWYSK